MRKALLLACFFLPASASAAAAQVAAPVARLEGLDLERLEVDGVTVLYSSADTRRGAGGLEEEARRAGAFFGDAVAFFDERLGEGLEVVVALLDRRDFGVVGAGRYAMPFSVPAQRLVVIPARTAAFGLQSGRDSAQARRILDVIRLHELGHAVAAAYLHPAGFNGDPPVRWFDELVASYLGHAYMRETMPELAGFAEALARDEFRRGAPHFTSLEAYERHYDDYVASPHGGSTLGWYHNVFNLRAAELHDEHGLDFFRAIRKRLPWMRYELWTTASLLQDLDALAPGFLSWAEGLEHFAPRR